MLRQTLSKFKKKYAQANIIEIFKKDIPPHISGPMVD
jgi:hypothetical protein